MCHGMGRTASAVGERITLVWSQSEPQCGLGLTSLSRLFGATAAIITASKDARAREIREWKQSSGCLPKPARRREEVVEQLMRGGAGTALAMVDALGKPWCYWDPMAKEFRGNKAI